MNESIIKQVIEYCVNYFNKHDVIGDDITSDDIDIISFESIGIGWKAVIDMPQGYVYAITTVDDVGNVSIERFKSVGFSIKQWEYKDDA